MLKDKKQKILESALKLFANEGFNAVSTSKIAKEAEVSEGLIFRHYKSKKGLLDAVLAMGVEKIQGYFEPIISEKSPTETIRKAIELPFLVDEQEYHFWKLQFKLKWEMEYSSSQKTAPLITKLTWAFTALGYEEPHKEAELLNHIVESISGGILKDGLQSQLFLKEFLINKYLN